MKALWQRWTTENHSFTMVPISEEEYRPFSGAVKEMLEKGPDGNYIFLSLRYAFPGVPKPGEKAKPITADQKLQNAIFHREMMKIWKESKEELRKRVEESVSRTQKKANENISRKGSGDNNLTSSMDDLAVATERNILIKLSIKRFKQWVEDDEDKKAEAEREKVQERQHEAKISHEQYVKKKDSLRIRLPPPDFDPRAIVNGRPRPKSATPSMSFGASQAVRKKLDFGPQTSVDLMANSGTLSSSPIPLPSSYSSLISLFTPLSPSPFPCPHHHPPSIRSQICPRHHQGSSRHGRRPREKPETINGKRFRRQKQF
jgi:hypothetical protein